MGVMPNPLQQLVEARGGQHVVLDVDPPGPARTRGPAHPREVVRIVSHRNMFAFLSLAASLCASLCASM